MKMHLLIIDPQNSFCHPGDQSTPKGELYVEGADQDMLRLAAFMDRVSPKIDDIHVTVDSHHLFDVAHPIYWKDSDGNHPQPFTIITHADVKAGTWKASVLSEQAWALEYTEKLESQPNKFPLCIWPPHCLIGTPGHNIYQPVLEQLHKWESETPGAIVDVVTKGSNYKTEHYGGLMAEVPDPGDPSTQLNTAPGSLIAVLQEVDIIVVAGEALSHCVATTLRQLIENFGVDNAKKLVLLEDCMSAVTGFEQAGNDFIAYAQSKGVRFENSTTFMV